MPNLLDLYKLIIENKASEYTIYCDMDGVLCDFDKGYEDLTKMSTAKANTYPKSFFWNFFRKKLGKTPERIFWSNLPPQPGGPELWKFIAPYKPNILSAPAIDFKLSQDQQLDPKYNEAIIGKKEWIDKNLYNVGEEIFVPAVQKAKFAAPNHILIDDMEKNITAWEAAGGIGILHKNATDTINTLKEKYGFNER
jgi:FMN phosphatase YigB (HAD superfamily)